MKRIKYIVMVCIVLTAFGFTACAEAPAGAGAQGGAVGETAETAAPSAVPEKTQPEKATGEGGVENDKERREKAEKKMDSLLDNAMFGEDIAYFFVQYGDIITTEEADALMSKLEDVWEYELEMMKGDYEYANENESFKKAFENGVFEQNIVMIEDEEIQALVGGTYADGFKLEDNDGFIFPVIDYRSVLANQGKYLSAEYQEYLEHCANQHESVQNPSVMPSINELLESALAFEEHLGKYPQGVTAARVPEKISTNLKLALEDKRYLTPDGKVPEEAVLSYKNFAEENPNSGIGGKVMEYVGLLEKNGNDAESGEVEAFYDSL